MTVTIDGTSGITYPAGTIQGTGYGPAFSAYQSSGTSCSSGANTKLLFQSEEYDTANCFDTSTSRFTPNVPGYYMISAYAYFPSNIAGQAMIYKNGLQTAGKIVNYTYATGQVGGSALIYMNGSTDYLEFYIFVNTTVTTATGSYTTYFQGTLVRGA